MKKINAIEKMIDTATAANMLGVTQAYLRLKAKKGDIPYYKPFNSSKYVFKMSDVQKALIPGRNNDNNKNRMFNSSGFRTARVG